MRTLTRTHKSYVRRYLEMIEGREEKNQNLDESDFNSLDRELLDDPCELEFLSPIKDFRGNHNLPRSKQSKIYNV